MYHQNKSKEVDYIANSKDETISQLQYKLSTMEKDLRMVFEEQLVIEKREWERIIQLKIQEEVTRNKEIYEREIQSLR